METSETLEESYKRIEKVIQSAVKDTDPEGGNIIFVGHARQTLDLMVIALKRLDETQTDYPPYQVNKNLRVPYCAIAAMRDKPWEVVCPPCPPSMHSSSGRFDWKMLLDL